MGLLPSAPGPLELLAPAGDGESVRAAVANGANAVYFGLQEFNARRRAANFTLESLPQMVDQLHGWNVKAYITFNTLIFPDELERAARQIAGIAEAGADALIVQDLGVLRLARGMCPSLPVHASTQMTQTHAGGIALLRDWGVSRVILARELSLRDIAAIHAETDMELEAFVHGALCVSYSGQCLASESLFGRSANRGLCAQPCRLPYQLVVDGEPRETPGGPHLLSPKDLATYERIPELISAGVTSFKIEGRLKSAEYVAVATSIYRAAIDAAVRGQPFKISEQQRRDLEVSFSRGFTAGFLDGNRHQMLIERSSPKSRGVRIGTVTGKSREGVTVRLDAHLKLGDGVAFEPQDPAGEQQGGRVYSVTPVGRSDRAAHRAVAHGREHAGGEWLLGFGSGDLDLSDIRVGGTIWRTDDPQARRRIEQSYSRVEAVHKTSLSVRARLLGSGQLALEFAEGDNQSVVEVRSDEPLAIAERCPLTTELLADQMGRLGETPYELGNVELLGPTGRVETLPVLAPKSVLNDLRRRAVAQLLESRRTRARKNVEDAEAVAALRAAAFRPPQGAAATARLHVLLRTPEQLQAILEFAATSEPDAQARGLSEPQAQARGGHANERFGMVYCDLPDLPTTREAVKACRAAGVPVALASPRILKPKEEGMLNPLLALAPDALLVRNLTALRHATAAAPGLAVIGDFSLNAANELTADLLLQAGLARVTASCDLNLTQLAALQSNLRNSEGLEVVIHQHVPMFHTAYCLAAACLGNSNDCRGCDRPCERFDLHLRDRLGIDHPLLTDPAGRCTIFNARPQSAAELWPELTRLGLAHYRIELLGESAAETGTLLAAYDALLTGQTSAHEAGARIAAVYLQGISAGTFAFRDHA